MGAVCRMAVRNRSQGKEEKKKKGGKDATLRSD